VARRGRPSTLRRGQVLLVDVEADTVIVDCLLCTEDDPTGFLATLRVRVTGEKAPSVVGFLRELQRSESLIDVHFGSGPGGALVRISSGTMTLVLERDD
jgi:hypothetical protein